MTTFDYSTFDEVRNPTLRTWNRINALFNITNIFGKESQMAKSYMKKINKNDQILLAKMAIKISHNGYENTRREIIRNNNAR